MRNCAGIFLLSCIKNILKKPEKSIDFSGFFVQNTNYEDCSFDTIESSFGGTFMEDNFGGRLSYVMSIRNMRQKELAKAANVTEATVSRYVNNKRSPDIDFIRAIVQILNVSADYLLGFSDNISIGGAAKGSFSGEDAKYKLISSTGETVLIKSPEQVRLLDAFFRTL